MLFKTHIVFSIAIFFLLNSVLWIPRPLLFFIMMMIATIIVDIDTKKSKIGNKWYLRPIQWMTKHRGLIHSLFFALLLSLIIASIENWAGVGFFAGYLSHLILDCLTKTGVALFWPITNKRIRLGIRSGGIIEQVLFVVLLLGNIFLVGKWLINYLF